MWKIVRFSLASRPLKTEILPLLALRLATRQSHHSLLGRNRHEETIHVCQHVFALKSDGENVSGAEIRLVAKFCCVAYLSRFCVLMLKMGVRDEFRGCFYGGVFGGQKRFHGVCR